MRNVKPIKTLPVYIQSSSNITMTIQSKKFFTAGVHVPSLTWFRDDAEQEIDWDVQRRHFEFLVDGSVHGGMA